VSASVWSSAIKLRSNLRCVMLLHVEEPVHGTT